MGRQTNYQDNLFYKFEKLNKAIQEKEKENQKLLEEDILNSKINYTDETGTKFN